MYQNLSFDMFSKITWLPTNSGLTVRAILLNYCLYTCQKSGEQLLMPIKWLLWRLLTSEKLLTVYLMLSYCISWFSIWSSRFSSIMADRLPNWSNSILGSKRPALNCAKRHLRDSPRISTWPNVVRLVHQWPTKCCYLWLCLYVRRWHHRLLHRGHCW